MFTLNYKNIIFFFRTKSTEGFSKFDFSESKAAYRKAFEQFLAQAFEKYAHRQYESIQWIYIGYRIQSMNAENDKISTLEVPYFVSVSLD